MVVGGKARSGAGPSVRPAQAHRWPRRTEETPQGSTARLPRWPDVAGVAWVVVAGVAVVVPALIHGLFLGPFDLLARQSASGGSLPVIHNANISDQVSEFIPWLSLSWQQVHAGHLPLWNPSSGLGAPLAFNWQSAPFGLPALVSYSVPLRYAFDASVAVTMAVAGTGAYVLGRVVGLGAVAAAMVGTVFELSGPMIAWIGSPLAGAFSWVGWLSALAVLVIRSRGKLRYLVATAAATALALLAGSPEAVVLMFGSVVIVGGVTLVFEYRSAKGHGTLLRSGLALVGAWIVGAMVAAPVLLPGLQVARASVRSQSTFNAALPLHDLIYFVVQGFDGLPLDGMHPFGGLPVIETMSFVGSVALVLSLVAVVHRGRRPEVLASGLIALAGILVVFVPSVVGVAKDLPLLGMVQWQRGLFPIAFALALLAGVGSDALARGANRRAPLRTLVSASLILSLALTAMAWWGRAGLSPPDAAARLHGLLAALVASLAMVAVGGGALLFGRRRGLGANGAKRGAAVVVLLLAIETTSLLAVGMPWPSSSPTGVPSLPAVEQLQRVVGSGTVGFVSGGCVNGSSSTGLFPNATLLYGLHQLDVYDASTPAELFTAWQKDAGTPSGAPAFYEFCPQITTSRAARLFGVEWVLAGPGESGPDGAIRAGDVGDDVLYRVPGAAAATVVTAASGAALPGIDAPGTAISVAHPDPSTWKVRTSATSPSVLRLRLADTAGWHGTVDGRPVPVLPFAGAMLQLRVPPGHHTVEVTYWPTGFSVGIVLALLGGAAVVAIVIGAAVRRRTSSARNVGSGGERSVPS
jgi:hypothetical protein